MNRKKYISNCCTGCGLCYSDLGVDIVKNKDGFLLPYFGKEDESDYYENICPMFRYQKENIISPLWGEYTNVYSGYSTNSEIRYMASSGGILTALSIYLLETGYVDGIIQTHAKEGYPLETETIISTTKEDILKCMGSRYSISMPLMNILSQIDSTKKYAFVGKPCDIIALKQYMEKKPNLKKQIVFTMSFFCAGMPSYTVNKKLLNKLGCLEKDLKVLRYRGNGWPGSTIAEDSTGKEYKLDYRTVWGDYLGRDVNKICRYCMDGIGELADISCADLWYLDNNNEPDFSEHEGRNVIFCRSIKAEKIIIDAKKKKVVDISLFTKEMSEFHKYQPYQFSRRVTMKYKLLALRLFGRFAPKYNKHLLNSLNMYSTRKMNWSIFKGTIKRIIKGNL